MKMTAEHYQHIKSEIAQLPRDRVLAHKALGMGKDPEVRFRWDLLYAAKLTGPWVSDNLYPYLNDDHIDTALKRIVIELEYV